MTNINDDTKLEKVIDFSSEKIDKKAFIFEEHSISIFKVLA